MINAEFCDCLRRLKLSGASARSAAALGLSVRHLQRIAAGHSPVSPTLALLVIAYLKRGGVPDPLWDPIALNNTLSKDDDGIRHATNRLVELFRRGS